LEMRDERYKRATRTATTGARNCRILPGAGMAAAVAVAAAVIGVVGKRSPFGL
jgi:hypothetical protein